MSATDPLAAIREITDAARAFCEGHPCKSKWEKADEFMIVCTECGCTEDQFQHCAVVDRAIALQRGDSNA